MDDTTHSDAERLARLRLIRASNIGAVTFWAMLERYGDARTAVAALPDLMRRSRSTRPAKLPSEHEAATEMERAASAGARVLMHGEDDYPRGLVELDVPPPIVTIRGDANLFQRDTIAIVGARNASALGQRFARDIAHDLGAAGIVIASGLARGIDTAAHKGSIETGTIAVMAGGVDIVYPPENHRLYEEIAAKGVVISELPMGQQPTAQHFPRRNRIISGLARGVIVVEATLNSGSLITARIAGEQGRDVFAVPGSPLDPRAKGTNGLLRSGAILTESAEDVLNALGPRQPTIRTAPKSNAAATAILHNTDALQREILKRLGPAPVEIDDLIRLLGASSAEVSAALLDLEFAGHLTRHPGQRISVSGGC